MMHKKRARTYEEEDDSDSAHSVDSTGKRKSFRRLITRFAEKTSMQGVPYLNNAKLLGAKVIWSVLLVIAIIALSTHLWFLVIQYYEWPKQTKIELGYSNLRFPDVTICNTNPIHKGRFDLLTHAKELKQLINDLNPRNLVPRQFDAHFDPLAPSDQQPPDSNTPNNTPTPTSQGSTGQTNAPTLSVTSSNPLPTDNTQGPTTQPYNQSVTTHVDRQTTRRNRTRSTRGKRQAESRVVTTTTQPLAQRYRHSLKTLRTTLVQAESRVVTTTTQPLAQVRRKTFADQYSGLNLTTYIENYQGFENYHLTANEFDGERAKTADIMDVFEELYMDIRKSTRAGIGHNISDMLLGCTFHGRVCKNREFRLNQTSELGNCWVLSSEKFNVQSPGPLGGLSLVLYLEAQEYLKGVTNGHGIRVQIHEPGTFPYPAEEGLFIPSSMETDIGLKMTLIDRIAGNYGECDKGVEFDETYMSKYTRRACQRMCRMKRVIDGCGCFSDRHEEMATLKRTTLKPCRSKQEKHCEKRLNRQHDLKTSECQCPNPCSEIIYTRSLSSRQWPNDDYARVLLEIICSEDKSVCARLRHDIHDQRLINNNFLKLNIYYEDLNFQNITEEPEIALAQFLSDIGGAVGLWIGLSVLSFCEIIQLIVELGDYFVNRTVKRRRREKRRASRALNEINTERPMEGDKHYKAKDDHHHRSHTSHNLDIDLDKLHERESSMSSPRLEGSFGRRRAGSSPFAGYKSYPKEHDTRDSDDVRHHGNEVDFFRRNYIVGLS